MTDIFREVEEDVRRERFEKLWKEYGHYAIAAAVLLIVAVGGYQFWTHYQKQQREQNAADFTAAIKLAESGKPLDAANKLGELAKDGTAGYRDLARLAQADALMTANKLQDAVSTYKEVADKTSNKQLANVARIRAAWILVESAPQSEVQSVLAPLTEVASPWHYMANEILAYSNFVAGRTAMAEQAYSRLAEDASAPAGVRNRSKVMAQFLASGAGADYGTVPPPAKPATPTATTTGAPSPAPAGKP